jgi:hypothetical protein
MEILQCNLFVEQQNIKRQIWSVHMCEREGERERVREREREREREDSVGLINKTPCTINTKSYAENEIFFSACSFGATLT